MTTAVCLECGAIKHGAWTPCPQCSYDPAGQGVETEARALYLSDHYLSAEALRVASEAIRHGQLPAIDERFVASLLHHARAEGKTTLVPSVRPTCLAALGLALLVLMLWALARVG